MVVAGTADVGMVERQLGRLGRHRLKLKGNSLRRKLGAPQPTA